LSGPTTDTGWHPWRSGEALATLMSRLGYDRYGAHGTDWGSRIVRDMALIDPQHLAGMHRTIVHAPPLPDDDLEAFTDEERERLGDIEHFGSELAGYMLIQSTRPQTLAYALTDSPVGQLAWIVEKYKEWTDSGSVPEDAVSREHILTTVSLFWFTATAGSSAQLYYESSRTEADFFRTWGGPWALAMPVGVAHFPKDAVRPIRRFAEGIFPDRKSTRLN